MDARPFEVRWDAEGVVWLSGELDMASVDSFSDRVITNVRGPQAVLDLSDLTFVDSSGIRAILRLAQACGQGVRLRNVPDNVRAVLAITGIDETMGVRIDPATAD